MIQIFLVDISPLFQKEQYLSIYTSVEAERRKKADALKLQADKARTIGAGWLLAQAYRDYTGQAELLPVVYGKEGKPYFESAQGKKVFFNLSHSGNFAVCAIGDSEVGIDIEKIRRYHPKLADRCFDSKDCMRIASVTDEEKDFVFTRIWTEYESCYKLTGKGIAKGMKEEKCTSADSGILEYQKFFRFENDYCLTIAAETPDIADEIIIKKM